MISAREYNSYRVSNFIYGEYTLKSSAISTVLGSGTKNIQEYAYKELKDLKKEDGIHVDLYTADNGTTYVDIIITVKHTKQYAIRAQGKDVDGPRIKKPIV